MSKSKSSSVLSRRELGRLAVMGAAGALLAPAARAQVVDPLPVDPLPVTPPPLPVPPETPVADAEGALLIKLVPINAGYTLSDTQATQVAAQLKDYPGGFAKARAYVLPDAVGPAFAADAPPRRKERNP